MDLARSCALGAVLHEEQKYDEAELRYREALEIFRQAFGERHPSVAMEYRNMARC